MCSTAEKEKIMDIAGAFKFKFDGTKIIVELDPNKNGKPVLTLTGEIDLTEVPQEILDMFKK